MRILVFGIGRFYLNRKDIINAYNDNIIAFIDNKISDDFTFEDKKVYLPSQIEEQEFDAILLMSLASNTMKDQLLELNYDKNKILTWEKYLRIKRRGEIKVCTSNFLRTANYAKRILIISTSLSYNGGSLAAIYAAKALQTLNYDVSIAVPRVNNKLLEEILTSNLRILIVPSLPDIGKEEVDWMGRYDVIFVNVFQMIKPAYELSKYKPVLWWIHEPSSRYCDIYETVIEEFEEENSKIDDSDIYICSVSRIAKSNFECFHNGRVNAVLPYGISDEAVKNVVRKAENTITFAVIGSVNVLKGQSVFIEAISMMPCGFREMSKFLIIGPLDESSSYVQRIRKEVENIAQVNFLGMLSREELRRVYYEIDVVVCASLEETMSLTITEGMMHGRICLTTDATGMADYIEDGISGFICAAGDASDMAEKMSYIVKNFSGMDYIRKNARERYEANFSLDIFRTRLEKELYNCEKFYNARAIR